MNNNNLFYLWALWRWKLRLHSDGSGFQRLKEMEQSLKAMGASGWVLEAQIHFCDGSTRGFRATSATFTSTSLADHKFCSCTTSPYHHSPTTVLECLTQSKDMHCKPECSNKAGKKRLVYNNITNKLAT